MIRNTSVRGYKIFYYFNNNIMESRRYDTLGEMTGINKSQEIKKRIESLYKAINLAINTNRKIYYRNHYGFAHIPHIEDNRGRHFAVSISLEIEEIREYLDSLLVKGMIDELSYVAFNRELDRIAYESIKRAMEKYLLGESNEMSTRFKMCEEKVEYKKTTGEKSLLMRLLGLNSKQIKIMDERGLICDCKRYVASFVEEMMGYLLKLIYPQIVDIDFKIDTLLLMWKAVEQGEEYSSLSCVIRLSAIKEKLQEEAKNIFERYREEVSKKKEEYLKRKVIL